MSDQSVQPVASGAAAIKRSRSTIDHMAISEVAAITTDPDTRKKYRDYEKQLADEVEQNVGKLAGPSPSPLVESLALTVALCEHDVRVRQTHDGPLKNRPNHQQNLDRSMQISQRLQDAGDRSAAESASDSGKHRRTAGGE